MDKISIIVPCYNVENLVGRCIESIMAQSISNVEIELILVDDKSTDNTLAVLSEYEEKYPDSIMLIPLENNGKQGRARNIGLTYASGNYICFVDADDAVDSRMLELLYQGRLQTGAEIVEAGYSMITLDKKIDVSPLETPTLIDFDNTNNKKWYLLNRAWKTSPWGRLYDASFLLDNDILFAENCVMEDILFSYRCLKYVKKFVLLPECLYHYYINPDGTMLNISKDYNMNLADVQNNAIDEILMTNRYNDCLEELEFAYFSKAFAEPMLNMLSKKELFSFEQYIAFSNEVISRFPNIVRNVYINNSEADEMILGRLLINNRIENEQALFDILYGESAV